MNVVIVDCFDTWEHRVDLLYKVLTEEGHKVKCLLSDYRHIEKVYRTDKKINFRFFHADRYEKNISPARLLSHKRLSSCIFRYIEAYSSKIDLLWVLAPPNCFIADAAKVKRRYPKIRLIIDLIDLWPETMPVEEIKLLLRPWRQLRDRNLKYVDAIVTECNLYREVLGNVLDGIDVHTLYLAREDKGYESRVNLPDDRINLCYLGSINNIIDIDAIGGVINEIRKSKPVELHIIGDGEKKNELRTMAETAGAKVIEYGKIYERELKQDIFEACHFGLNIMKTSVCVGLTMKSIDYFELGLPIINNIKGDTWEIIERYGCGVNLDDNFSAKRIMNISNSINVRKNGREVFELYLSEDHFAKRVREILELWKKY